MKRIVCAAAVILLILGAGVWVIEFMRPRPVESIEDGTQGSLRLKIELIGRPARERIAVKATITNQSQSNIFWDTDFALGLHWQVVGDVNWLKNSGAGTFGEWQLANRFIALKPGEAIDHVVQLTEDVPDIQEASGRVPSSRGKSIEIGSWAIEKSSRLQVSRDARQISVRLIYDPRGTSQSRGVEALIRHRCTNAPARNSHMYRERIESNQLLLKIPRN